ncbi:zinc transport system ATP-binding protein [Frischella perrara]|uniref:ABC-type Mn/Zn transport system, ATPase component n=1 Tax=Frischella perrara TaxID=1267021 RepID=A0A0A7S472_FRIPE|nr:zinc ABC transporter ATP-binding protein ZnuC [Frischella perrara]AJA44076.1 ABC-type Mn/Zn transport system, ATPase component [Frischella perrara]PWV59146.1 zinc transport system ATP-binding protein [Frischella perrara]
MKPIVSIKNVSVNLNNQNILHNISFDIEIGKIITILGPNGAGKSTLVKLILDFFKPTTGKISRKKNLSIGYVPQTLQVDKTLPLTVKRFMKLNKKFDDNEIVKMLQKVNAISLMNKTMHQLSGGEMQRVLLAQALIKKPELLILDEPTQGVDVNGQITLYNLISNAKNEFNCAVVMISHDLHLVMAKTDEVICLNKHICCSGTPALVSNDPEFIALFGRNAANQLAIYKHHHFHQKRFQGRIHLPNFGAK